MTDRPAEPTLSAFLLARIAEDEAVAQAAGPDGGEWSSRTSGGFHNYGEFGWVVSGPDVETEDSDWGKATADHIARHDPARVLARCKADRRIVYLHSVMGDARLVCIACWSDYFGGHEDWPCATLLALAWPYAEHPDYRQEWKP